MRNLVAGIVLTMMLTACETDGGGWSSAADGVVAGPLLAGDRLVVAEQAGGLAALDPATGDELWRTKVFLDEPPGTGDRADLLAGFDGLVASDSAVFAASVGGLVCAHDLTDGAQRWCIATDDGGVPAAIDFARTPRLAVHGDQVVVATRDEHLLWLNAADGAEGRRIALPRGLEEVPTVHSDGQLVVTQYRPEEAELPRLVALDGDTGNAAWEDDQQFDRYRLRSGVLFDGDQAVVATRIGVSAVDLRTGRSQWTWHPGEDIGFRAPVAGVEPLRIGDTVLAVAEPTFSGTEAVVVALDLASGEQRWRSGALAVVPRAADFMILAPAGDDRVAVLGRDLAILDTATGEAVAQVELGLDRPSGLVIIDGDAIVASGDRVRRLALPAGS